MRKITFRAWNKREKRMMYAEEMTNGKGDLFAIGFHGLPIAVDKDSFKEDQSHDIVGWNVDHFIELLQCTGLPDKNGKDIYEGDIVLHHDHDLKSIVKWCDGRKGNLGAQVGWTLNNGYYTVDFVANQKYPSERDYEYLDVTVLGNIYEHPELLADMGSFGYDPLTGEQTGHGEK